MSASRALYWRVDLALREPYTIAYETYDSATNFFFRIERPRAFGVGCASPAPEVTGESAEECGAALAAACELLEEVSLPLDTDLRSRLRARMAATPAAGAAVDMALHDLHARTLGVPLHDLWGRARRGAVTSVTLGIESVDETLRRGEDCVAQGFRALKVKGGRDPEEDIERVRRLHERHGPQVELRLDANQGYSEEAAAHVARSLADVLELLEQPLPAGEADAARRLVRALAPLPLVADESFVSLAEGARLCASAACSGLNVKLMKVGSLADASAAARLAGAFGHACMVSCMDESALAIGAALHWALGHPEVRWFDLDGHLDLIEDPAPGAVQLEDGELRPVEKPGLGVDLQPPA